MRVLGVPLPFYKSPTLLLGWGVSPFVFWQLLKARPDVIHAAFPGALRSPPPLTMLCSAAPMRSARDRNWVDVSSAQITRACLADSTASQVAAAAPVIAGLVGPLGYLFRQLD